MRPRRPARKRVDVLLVEQGLAGSRDEAQRLILAGEVTADGSPVATPGTRVPEDTPLSVAPRPPYASRGGQKLAFALDTFAVSVEGLVVADVGASTGGFTDCLLQRGASRVYAIDVGYGQLAWPLRQDPRVVVMERTNARYLESLPERVHLAAIDVSFISLTLILPRIYGWLAPDGLIVSLIKPQFEAGRDQVGKGGVIRDPCTHRQVLHHILEWAVDHRLPPLGLVRSPITGPAGNAEFLALLAKSSPESQTGIEALVEAVLTPND